MTKPSKGSYLTTVDTNIELQSRSWSFNTKGLEQSFSKHIQKSIPGYLEGHKLICELSDYFINPYSQNVIYDLGCSTGELSAKLGQRHETNSLQIYALDCEESMINKAKENFATFKQISFLCEDFLKYNFVSCGLMISYFTLQFIPMAARKILLERVYASLIEGGAFIVFEKVLEDQVFAQDCLSTLYRQFKLDNGLKAEQVLTKEQSLKGVLCPLTRSQNFLMYEKAGFDEVTLLTKNLHFEGYLLRKL